MKCKCGATLKKLAEPRKYGPCTVWIMGTPRRVVGKITHECPKCDYEHVVYTDIKEEKK